MSSAITPTAGYDGIASALLHDSANVKQQLDTLLQQAGSGYQAGNYAGLGASAETALSVAPQIAEQQGYQANINAATGQMQVTQTALQQISAIASTFYADAAQLTNVAPSGIDSTAQAARQALQQVAQLLNTTDGSLYVFGGQDSRNPPVPNADNILSSGFVTQIQTAVAGLSGSGAAGVMSSVLAVAGSNAAGTSLFSGSLSQPAATLQAEAPSVATGPGQQSTIGIPASANGFVTSTGSFTTGSYTRDILGSLATIGSMSSTQANDSGFATLVQDVHGSLGGAITALNQDAGALGTTQSTLTSAQSAIGSSVTALQTQLSGAQDANMATVLSQITATETRLQASYQLLNSLQTYSLAKILSPVMG